MRGRRGRGREAHRKESLKTSTRGIEAMSCDLSSPELVVVIPMATYRWGWGIVSVSLSAFKPFINVQMIKLLLLQLHHNNNNYYCYNYTTTTATRTTQQLDNNYCYNDYTTTTTTQQEQVLLLLLLQLHNNYYYYYTITSTTTITTQEQHLGVAVVQLVRCP